MRLRFTIRDLLWLTLVVAMAVGWFVNRTHFKSELAHFKSELAAKDHQINDLEQLLTAPLNIPSPTGSGIVVFPPEPLPASLGIPRSNGRSP